MSDQLKVRLISWGNTFATGFLLSVATALYLGGTVQWTSAFWIGLVITGTRAGIAEVVKLATPQKLGGRRK